MILKCPYHKVNCSVINDYNPYKIEYLCEECNKDLEKLLTYKEDYKIQSMFRYDVSNNQLYRLIIGFRLDEKYYKLSFSQDSFTLSIFDKIEYREIYNINKSMFFKLDLNDILDSTKKLVRVILVFS